MNEDEMWEALAALRASNDERAARIRRGWFWLGSAVACAVTFAAVVVVMLRTNPVPWWLGAVGVAFEVGSFACLWRAR
jgi:hypothetical protein